MEMLRLNNPPGIQKARQILNERGALFVSFAAQGTHLPLLIVHKLAVIHYGYTLNSGYAGTGSIFGDSYHYVALIEFGSAYPFMLGHLTPGYVAEKLRMKNEADALNVTAFLNALGQITGLALDDYLARLKMNPYDPTALDFDYYRGTGGPR